jgi:hypothetical protein
MKAVLEFNLNERDEQVAHIRCVRNWELAWALHSVMEEIKKAANEHDSINPETLLNACNEIIQDNHLSLDEMVY